MAAVDDLMKGRFESAIEGYQKELAADPDDLGAVSGMGSALLGAARYTEAIPFLEREDADKKRRVVKSCGLQNQLAYAHWCAGQKDIGISLMVNLCTGLKSGKIMYATDAMGGGVFGLILYYMAVTLSDDDRLEIALQLLKKLSEKQHKRYAEPDIYPIGCVDYVLGLTNFEGMIRTTTEGLSLKDSLKVSTESRALSTHLGLALLTDGAVRRYNGDEEGCQRRLREVFALGYRTDGAAWALARCDLGIP